MAEGSGSQKVNPNLVAEIVSNYVAKNSVPVDQVEGLIAAIHQTLSGLGSAEPTPTPAPLVPAVPSADMARPFYSAFRRRGALCRARSGQARNRR